LQPWRPCSRTGRAGNTPPPVTVVAVVAYAVEWQLIAVAAAVEAVMAVEVAEPVTAVSVATTAVAAVGRTDDGDAVAVAATVDSGDGDGGGGAGGTATFGNHYRRRRSVQQSSVGTCDEIPGGFA